MKNNEIKYNTRIRQAISDELIKCSKTKAIVEKEREDTVVKLQLGMETLSYKKYVSLQEKADKLAKEINDLKIQYDTWDKAREICLDIADEFFED